MADSSLSASESRKDLICGSTIVLDGRQVARLLQEVTTHDVVPLDESVEWRLAGGLTLVLDSVTAPGPEGPLTLAEWRIRVEAIRGEF
jgi:hypothetical protein